jgi:ribosomal protein L37E
MNKIKEIVTAWIVSINPNDDEKLLAEKRYEICFTCTKRGSKMNIEICTACGCPLSKKIFTLKDEGSCPLKKWDDVDSEFREIKKNKYKII